MPHKPGPHRNIGTGGINLEKCPECGFRIPRDFDVESGKALPCSPYHIRCVRCEWPIARTHVLPGGLCVACSEERVRRNYYRRSEEGWINGGKPKTEAKAKAAKVPKPKVEVDAAPEGDVEPEAQDV